MSQNESKVVSVVKKEQSTPSFVKTRLQAHDRERLVGEGWNKPDVVDEVQAQKRVGTPSAPPPRPEAHERQFRFKRLSALPEEHMVSANKKILIEERQSIPKRDEENKPPLTRISNQLATEPVRKKVSEVVNVVNEGLESFPVPDGVGLPRMAGPSDDAMRLVRDRLRGRHEERARARGLVPGDGAQPGRYEGTMVSRATMEQYLQRGQGLFDRWRLETGAAPEGGEDADPIAFVNWLLSRKPSVKASTWRMYRQAAMHWLDGFPSQDTSAAIGLLEVDTVEGSRPGVAKRRWEEERASRKSSISKADRQVEDADTDDSDDDDDDDEGGRPGRRTSALKEKRFPEEMLERVRMRLRLGSRSRLNEALADWLETGVLTALRPVEWGAVDLVMGDVPHSETHPYGRVALLYVINAKATNGRGTGVSRTLDLSMFTDENLAVVRRHAARCRAWLESDTFPRMKAQCSALLRNTVRALWPSADGTGTEDGRHYALYSCRHQAIANWKSINMPLEELAALVGHAVTATATERYGKRRSGWRRPSIPQPPRGVPEEVGLVRSRINMFQERVRLEKELGITRSGPGEFPV